MYSRYSILRDERGYTDYAVIKATGIKESTFYDWRQRSKENPQTRLSVDSLAKIAKLFGVAIEDFLEEGSV